jgi:hypothetical protein
VLRVELGGGVPRGDLDVVPPNPGVDATVVLSIQGGDTYCASFGGAAGGISGPNDARFWRVRNATAETVCPMPPPPICCQSFLASCIEEPVTACVQLTNILLDVAAVCDGTGHCVVGPGIPGPCCEGDGPEGTSCSAGSDSIDYCPGTIVQNAVCLPSGECASPSGAFVEP